MRRFKQAIILAAKFHEESWDVHKGYLLSLEVACDQAAGDVGFDLQANKPIHLLLKNSWSEILRWANEK